MKRKILTNLFLSLIIFNSCSDYTTQPKNDIYTFRIIFGKSIEGVEIGDDSNTVIRKLGQPTEIHEGDFNGYIYYYLEGRLANTFVGISKDNALGLGVIGVNIEKTYQGKSKDSIGIGSERNFVISKIGLPDTTQGESPLINDIYFYENNTFAITYENQSIHRISMSVPRYK